MMIQALQELMTQQPEFEPELTVVGTTSGGMSYGERYYRSLNGAGDLRHAPTWIANYPAQKPVIDAQTAFRNFSAVSCDRERLCLRDKCDRSRI